MNLYWFYCIFCSIKGMRARRAANVTTPPLPQPGPYQPGLRANCAPAGVGISLGYCWHHVHLYRDPAREGNRLEATPAVNEAGLAITQATPGSVAAQSDSLASDDLNLIANKMPWPVGLMGFIMIETSSRTIFGGIPPWGRWPLAVHTAGWGILANICVCVAVSARTQAKTDNVHRCMFHHTPLNYASLPKP